MAESKKREAGLLEGTWKNHLSVYQWKRGRGGEGGEAVQGMELALLSAFPGSMSNLPYRREGSAGKRSEEACVHRSGVARPPMAALGRWEDGPALGLQTQVDCEGRWPWSPCTAQQSCPSPKLQSLHSRIGLVSEQYRLGIDCEVDVGEDSPGLLVERDSFWRAL